MRTFITVMLLFCGCCMNAQTWAATGTIGGGNEKVKALATDGTRVLAGTGSAGVMSSTNSGQNWQAINTGITNLDITSLLVNGTDYYAGTNGGGVFLSTNGGQSWSAVQNGLQDLFITSLAASGSTIFAGTMNSGVFLSTNKGSNWVLPALTGLTNPQIRSLHVSGSVLLAGTNGPMGIYRSLDNGATWSAASGNVTNSYILSFIDFGGSLFAGSGCCVLKSTDAGVSWAPSNTSLGSSFYGFASSGNNLYAATHTNYGAYISTNNGVNFSVLGTNLGNLDLFSIVLSGTDIFVGTDGSGVWKLSTGSGTITAIDNTENPMDIRVHPNPSKGRFVINTTEQAQLTLLNAQGQVVNSLTIHEETSIESNLSAGIYFLRLCANNKVIVKKLVIE